MAQQSDEIVARLVERVDGRYFGKYRGKVTNNDDPWNAGRLKASVTRLLGDKETNWALPALPYGGTAEQGLYAVPDVGAGVWIEFEEGDLSAPIWTGTWYAPNAVPESAQPAQKVLKTKSGHKVVLDDDGGSVEVTDSNGNTIRMDASVIKVQAQGALKIVIDAPQIELVENAEHPLVFGDNLLEYLNQLVEMLQAHVHPGELALGAFPVTPAPPVPVFPPATPDLLSLQVKTG